MKVLSVLMLVVAACARRYRQEWNDIDSRPLPEWYDKAKIGVMLTWGVFSVPSFKDELFWNRWRNNDTDVVYYMKNNYPPDFTYQDFAQMFTAEFFEPYSWAQFFADIGARYVIVSAKHHEGFRLFPSNHSWNSVNVGPKRDIVGELHNAVKSKNLKFGVHYSLIDWYDTTYLEDKEDHFMSNEYPVTKVMPDLTQLVNVYQPSIIWGDGDWDGDDGYWNSTGFLAWLYSESPVKDEVVVNDKWGKDTNCTHGGFHNCENRFNPEKLEDHKFENVLTLDLLSWGYRRRMQLKDVVTMEYLMSQIIPTVSCGGNALLNLGPTKEGTIPLIFQDRLNSLGEWLKINGEAIYGTSPWYYQSDGFNRHIWYTCTKSSYNTDRPTAIPQDYENVTAIYAVILKWPRYNHLKIMSIAPFLQDYKMEMLGSLDAHDMEWSYQDRNGMATIRLPDKEAMESEHAWVIKFTSIL